MQRDTRFDLNDTIDRQTDRNRETKRNPQKFCSKLRRWQTRKLGGRARRVQMIEAYPCLVFNHQVVK